MRNLMETNPPSLDSELIVSPAAVISAPEADTLHACKILIIDDEKPNVRLLERVLAQAGFDNFISTSDSSEAAALFIDFEPDLVLTDWLMPGFDGCAIIGQLRALMATDDYLPIVVLTADITPRTRQRALTAGATDFLTKPFEKIEVLLRIQNLLKARLSSLLVQAQNATLEESVRQRTIELERALNELQRTQRQVIQQERLAALGTMAGGIAHDFNNALSIIMGFGELLLRDLKHGLTEENAAEPITAILTAAEDASKIVQRLSDFYRPAQLQERRVPIELNALVRQAVILTQPKWQTQATAADSAITIVTQFEEIPMIIGDPVEFREALTNLIFNAVDALPKGGIITFATSSDEEFTVLKVTDTGTGMNEEVRQRCLEPFFTTKGSHGTGFGLSMVFGIIQRHGGTIAIESKLGQGTTFIIRLPVAPAAPATARAENQYGQSLRILVVDDLSVLAQHVCGYLQDDHHIVESALSGSEALERFRTGEFDLVITDHVMTEMTGEQLSVAIKRLSPSTPVILLTGYIGETSKDELQSPTIDLLLAKPLTRSALRQAVVAVMTAAQATCP